MKKLLSSLLISVMLFQPLAYAKGGISSGGSGSNGARGGFSSSSGARSSSPSSTVSRPSTTTTTTTTTSRSYSYGGGYVHPYGGYYGGFGTVYGYNNGLLTGLIIGNMMHPYGTVLYTGPGMYANNALLYPDGRVVNNQGVLIGNYIGGQFVPITNGTVVAQPVPQDAIQQQQQPTPIRVVQETSTVEYMAWAFGIALIIVLIILIL